LQLNKSMTEDYKMLRAKSSVVLSFVPAFQAAAFFAISAPKSCDGQACYKQACCKRTCKNAHLPAK